MRYLREKYKVTDPDLLAIAKHFNNQLEPEDTEWDQQMQAYLRKRRGKGS